MAVTAEVKKNETTGNQTATSVATASKKEAVKTVSEVAKSKFPLTFDDPSKYRGPVVEGWPPGKNRSLERYLRPTEANTFPMVPTSEAVGKCQLLVVVHSPPDYFEARMGIRNTYGRYVTKGQAGNTAIVFLIGKTVASLKTSEVNATRMITSAKLRQEQQFFGDILQVSILISALSYSKAG